MRVFLVGFVVIVLGLSAGAGWYLTEQRSMLEQPLRNIDGQLEITVVPGATLTELARGLHADGHLRNAQALIWHARWYGLSTQIKAGEYQVSVGTSPLALLDQLIAGQVVQWPFTIIEGWTFKTLRAELADHEKIIHTLTGKTDDQVMALLGHPGVHPEGWFYPDTYHFPAGTTDVEFLRRSLNLMHETLNTAWEGRAEGLPFLQPYEALVLASIVERETAAVVERADIAGVFVRRLRKGMKLEADPTVIYGLGDSFNGNLTRKHLKTDTPYNTYIRRGLPPTPIALPSGDAVRATLNPQDGDTLFFVARGDGSGTHQFSATYAEHKKAVETYLRNRKKRLSGDDKG